MVLQLEHRTDILILIDIAMSHLHKIINEKGATQFQE